MQGRKIYSEKLFCTFQLFDRVPEDNFYIHIALSITFTYFRALFVTPKKENKGN